MECSEPGTIRDEELIAYLSGEQVRPAVIEHLAHCQSCSSRLATYRQLEHKLIRKLYRWDCPSNQILGEYHLGLLDKQQAMQVEYHLRLCVLCAAEVAALTEFLANDPMLVERSSASQTPVSSLPSSANSHAPEQSARQVLDRVRDRAQAGARRIAAILQPPQPRFAFQRNTSNQAELWPRRYDAEDVSVSIQVERMPGRGDALQIIGLVARKGAALGTLQGTPVQLLSGTTAYTQNIDELGNFVFSSVTPATYTLELHCPEGIIVVDQLPITLPD